MMHYVLGVGSKPHICHWPALLTSTPNCCHLPQVGKNMARSEDEYGSGEKAASSARRCKVTTVCAPARRCWSCAVHPISQTFNTHTSSTEQLSQSTAFNAFLLINSCVAFAAITLPLITCKNGHYIK